MREFFKVIFLLYNFTPTFSYAPFAHNQSKYSNNNTSNNNTGYTFRNFAYLLNPKFEICSREANKSPIFLLIYVHTSPENYKRRLVIRETWSQKHLFNNTRLVFFSGLSRQNHTNEMLRLEHSIYNDIVQNDYLDSYRNLTLKSNNYEILDS